MRTIAVPGSFGFHARRGFHSSGMPVTGSWSGFSRIGSGQDPSLDPTRARRTARPNMPRRRSLHRFRGSLGSNPRAQPDRLCNGRGNSWPRPRQDFTSDGRWKQHSRWIEAPVTLGLPRGSGAILELAFGRGSPGGAGVDCESAMEMIQRGDRRTTMCVVGPRDGGFLPIQVRAALKPVNVERDGFHTSNSLSSGARAMDELSAVATPSASALQLSTQIRIE